VNDGLADSFYIRNLTVFDSNLKKKYRFIVYKWLTSPADKPYSVYEFTVADSADLGSFGHLFLTKFITFFSDIFPFTSVHSSSCCSRVPKLAQVEMILLILSLFSLLNEYYLIENFDIKIGK
jgi:hypothetical protein